MAKERVGRPVEAPSLRRRPKDPVNFRPRAARERLRIVSSPSDYAFTAGVSEDFAQLSRFPAPSIELTGTATAIDLFCAGLGEGHPDIIGASRAMWDSAYRKCQGNGVRNITAIQIGYEGIVLAG